MRTLNFITIIITLFFLVRYNVSLTTGETVALNDMYNQWKNILLEWKLPVSNACVNWTGVSCNTNLNVDQMFVKIF